MQTNIWQDPYVKSEAVLFLYELDSDSHTAAMMMCQEEEQGMFESGDAFGTFGCGGLGNAGFGNGGTAGGVSNCLEIPHSLPPSMLSALGGMSASYAGGQGTTSKTTSSAASEAIPPSLNSPALSSEHKKDSKISSGSVADETARNCEAVTSDSKAEEALNSGTDFISAQSAHVPLTLEDIEFLVTPNKFNPLVANRKSNGKEVQAGSGDAAETRRWECEPFQVCSDAALVCVSGMAPLHKEAAPDREVLVSILRLPDREQVCGAKLCSKQPSQILQLPSEEVEGCTYAACFEELKGPACAAPSQPAHS